VHFTGLLSGVDGEGVYLWRDPAQPPDRATVWQFYNKKIGFQIPDYKKFIFKYPRVKYLGIRVQY